MAKYEIGTFLFCLHIINVCNGFGSSFLSKAKNLGMLISQVKDENTKAKSQLSHIHCLMECLIRKPCVFVSSSHIERDILARDRPYKCFLYLSNETERPLLENECRRFNYQTAVLPQAIAGACSDHKCSTCERCVPLPGGGYQCKLERRRGNRKKPKRWDKTTRG